MQRINVVIPGVIQHRLEIIESEIHELKHLIKKSMQDSRVRKTPRLLRGILSGVRIRERDIEQSKRSLFKNANL